MKIEKNTIGLVLILIMVASTFAFTITQKQDYFYREEEGKGLPTQRILSYMSEPQKTLAISNGFTIIYFNYTSPYDEVKSYLEALARDYYVYVIESYSTERYLRVESLKGSREIKDPNINQTIDVLCQIMINRPIDCVLREIG